MRLYYLHLNFYTFTTRKLTQMLKHKLNDFKWYIVWLSIITVYSLDPKQISQGGRQWQLEWYWRWSQSWQRRWILYSVPAPPSFFIIPQTAWKKLRKKTKKGSLLSSGIRTIHPHCSFAFTCHRVKIQGWTRNTPAFKCSGYGLFTDCPVQVDVVVHSENTLKAGVVQRWHGSSQ